jgi:mannose-6-phosphate isomerase-like protein (cupin superfamily)
MHYVSKFDPSKLATPPNYVGKSDGYKRFTMVDQTNGSVHMGVGINLLESSGVIAPHLHSFEESFIILEGEVIAQIGDSAHRLSEGDYALISTGVKHAFRNTGNGPARWLEMQSPQPRRLGYGGRDTFFVSGDTPQEGREPDLSDPANKLIGYFDESQLPKPGAPAQMEGFNPTTGVAIKMFVDRSFGAIHQSLFLIQYMPGASIAPHDHTFEESYYIVSGEVEAMCDGKTYRVGQGGAVWTGVGCIHSFENKGEMPVRWIETQAPLPPAKEVFRFEKDWDELRKQSQ